MYFITPLRLSGKEHLPDGPGLILSNHSSLLDPWWTITAANRTINYLATAAAMQHPLMGRVLRTFGSVPKKKGTTDVTSIRLLKKWCDLGNLVGSYPEGERSWDGELLPLLPGIEALVRLLKVPVIPTRILNADRVMPRWAEKRRTGPVLVEFGQPRMFERRADPNMVREWIREQLTIDQSDEANHFPVHGTKLAHGLENPMFRCPSCFAWDALIPAGDAIRCRECTATWTVDTRNHMLGESGGAQSTTIVEARRAILARTRESFIVDERRFEREGIVAESEPATLLDVTGADAERVGAGRLLLTAQTLAMIDADGGEVWRLELDDLRRAVVEIRRQLVFRTRDDRLFEVVLPKESPLKWAELVEHWRQVRAPADPEAQR